jgi:hypothetical protein
MWRAVARKLTHQVSTRNYAGTIDDCLAGSETDKSSVSGHWKAAGTDDLQRLFCRDYLKVNGW